MRLSEHAVLRMAEREISPAMVEEVLKKPIHKAPCPGGCGAFRYYSPVIHGARRDWLAVIVGPDAKYVITAMWGRAGGRRYEECNHRRFIEKES